MGKTGGKTIFVPSILPQKRIICLEVFETVDLKNIIPGIFYYVAENAHIIYPPKYTDYIILAWNFFFK